MMYPYMTLADETEIVHSQIVEKDGMKKVIVNFERPTEDGFDSARCELPDYKWTERQGYTVYPHTKNNLGNLNPPILRIPV